MAVLGNNPRVVGHRHRQVHPDDQLDVVPAAGGHRIHHQLEVFLHPGGADHREAKRARRPALGHLHILAGGVGHRFVLAAPMAVGDDVVPGVGPVGVGSPGCVLADLAVMDDRIGRFGPELVAGRSVVGLEEVGEQIVLGPHDGSARGPHLLEHLGGSIRIDAAPPLGPGHVQDVQVSEPSRQLVVGDASTSGHHPVGQRVIQRPVVGVFVDGAAHPQAGGDLPGEVHGRRRLELGLAHPGQLAPEAAPLGDAAGVDGLELSGADLHIQRPAGGFSHRQGERAGKACGVVEAELFRHHQRAALHPIDGCPASGDNRLVAAGRRPPVVDDGDRAGGVLYRSG